MPLILKLDKEQNADDYRYLNIPEEENLIKLIYRDMVSDELPTVPILHNHMR